MLPKKKIITAGATFGAALGIGFVMQNGDVLAARFGSEPQAPVVELSAPVASSQISEVTAPVVEPSMEEPVLIAQTTPDVEITVIAAPKQLAALAPDPVAGSIKSAPVSKNCSPRLEATGAPGAFALLDLTAPCHINTGVTIHHQGMMFSAVTDFDGHLSVNVPALTETAVFIAAFDTGAGAVATLDVPELAQYDRAVLQWQGEDVFAINAFENGATFGEQGHVSAERGRDVAALDNGEGFIMQLGDPAAPQQLLAEVYTVPADSGMNVVLSVDAEITKGNCGDEISAQSLQVVPGEDIEALDLVMIMPACDTVGDYLVLNNMFEDLKLAAN